MKHLSLMTALMLSSSMVYAQNCEGWQSAANGRNFKGDCYEMMCDCVEKDGVGYCCPAGTSTENTGASHPDLCPCKCPENQTWDLTTNSCISSKVCTTLYKNKNKINDERDKAGECCEPEQQLVSDRANTLFNGYKSQEERYGCCLAQNVYIKTDGTTGCCNPETHVLLDMTGTTKKACCPNKTPTWEECKDSYCSVCATGNELSGVTFDNEKMLQDAGCQCSCNTEAGYNLHQLSDGTYGCLPYCTKNSGVFLLVDRSGSTFDIGTADICDSEKDPCKKINRFLNGLDLSDRNYAIYNEETSNCGYNQAMSVLPFGQHSRAAYNLWANVNYQVKCNDSSGTYFDEALKHIESKYCKKDEPIVIMIITDGEVQTDKDKMASSMNNMMGKCNAQVIYIGPNSSTLKKYMNKNVSNFISFDFNADSVNSWINSMNKAITGSCIPTDNSDKIFNRFDSSWFCNVLNGGSVTGNSYLHLTKEQCFSCSNTKYRKHKSQNKWGDTYVCCGEYNNKGSCKDSQYDWEYAS